MSVASLTEHRTPRATVAAAVLSLILATAMAPPPATRAADSVSSGTFSGRAGCIDLPPKLSASKCKTWSRNKPLGEHTWSDQADEQIPGALSMRAKGNFTVTETVDAAGTLTSIVITVHIEGSTAGGGIGIADFNYGAVLPESATSVTATGVLSANASGSNLVGSFTRGSITVNCGEDELDQELQVSAGAGYPTSASDSKPLGATIDAGEGTCGFQVNLEASSGTNRPAPGESGRGAVDLALTIAIEGGPQGCSGLSGKVFSSAPGAHDHPLLGIRMQLWRAGTAVGTPVATEPDGSYCIRAGESVQPGPYRLRATLVDQLHEPPIFETHIAGATDASFRELDVAAEDFGPDNGADLYFDDPANPNVADTAEIHRETARFVAWLTDTLGLPSEVIGSFTVVTTDPGSSTRYDPGTHTVYITSDGTETSDSLYSSRDEPLDDCPENCEWHEVAHRLADSLGIAPTSRASACAGRANHAGWDNTSTCDSVAEGFAIFLSTVASLNIDEAREGGYATPFYGSFWSLEDNWVKAWSPINSAKQGREDFAFAALLWDLYDGGPQEDVAGLGVQVPGAPVPSPAAAPILIDDNVSIDAGNLVDLMRATQPETVVDLYEALQASEVVPPAAKTADVDVDGNGTPDLTPIDQVFLMHGFYPVTSAPASSAPAYLVGTPVGRTDHTLPGASAPAERRHIEHTPGSAIRLVNGTAAAVSTSIVLGYPTGESVTSATFKVSVPANGEKTLRLEAPPYWTSILAAGEIPACGGADQRPVTITISAPEGAPTTLDSCAYIQAMAKAKDGVALTVTVAGTAPAASEGTDDGSPWVPVTILVMVAVAGVAIGLVLARRRSASTTRR